MGLEVLELLDLPDGFMAARCAWNGKLAVPFTFHKADINGMRSEDFMAFLDRFAQAMVEQFGDARDLPFRGEREAEGEMN